MFVIVKFLYFEYTILGGFMDYLVLVNRDNILSKTYLPDNLIDCHSQYKEGILVNKMLYQAFMKMKNDASKMGYNIDIMSGYRDYEYQDKIYNRLILEKGFNYAFRTIAPPGASEHQTGLAIDICVYRGNNCYIENEIAEMEEIRWVHDNAYKYGFILRYPVDKESITGYNYEPWHLRYVGNVAKDIYSSKLTLEEYLKK